MAVLTRRCARPLLRRRRTATVRNGSRSWASIAIPTVLREGPSRRPMVNAKARVVHPPTLRANLATGAPCRKRVASDNRVVISIRLQRYQPTGCPIPAVTVRQISAQTHRALKARARRHGRSTEAEIRAILDAAVAPSPQPGIGSALARFGRRFHGVDLEIERDRTPPEPIGFE
jgi:antitoxin FitA